MKIKLIKFLLPLCLLFACLGFAACDKEALPEQLSAPQNLRVEGNFLVWDEVEHADGYSVFLGNQEYLTEECRYGLSGLEETEVYPIEVMAFSDRGISHSESSYFQFAGRFALPTKGLQYELKSDNTLRVSKFAVDSNGLCVIPATYQGYKVTSFTTIESMATMTSPTTFQAVCKEIKCLYLPYYFAKAGGSAFEDFTNLEEIVLGKDLENGETRFVSEGNCIIDKESSALVLGCVNSVIPNYVTKIGNGAFRGRKNITAFTVPDQITEIGQNAFSGCTALHTVKLSDRITKIGNSAFYNCFALQSVDLPKNLSFETFNIFCGCSSLTEITVPEGVVNLNEAFSGCTSLKEVRLPESVQSMKYAFRNCTSLELCTVPKGVKSLIGTFSNCSSLKEVVLPEGLEEIDKCTSSVMDGCTFYKCTALSEIALPSTLKTIGIRSFYGCTSLQSIEIPEGVTEIGEEAFSNCSSLQSINIPENVTEIGRSAFSYCTLLKNITIPNDITKIGANAFGGCTSLESIIIPEGMSLAYYLFGDCIALKSVVILNTKITIGMSTFENCNALETVYFAGTEAEWSENVKVSSIGNDSVLAATRYYYSETAPTEEGNYWRFVDGVPTIWN